MWDPHVILYVPLPPPSLPSLFLSLGQSVGRGGDVGGRGLEQRRAAAHATRYETGQILASQRTSVPISKGVAIFMAPYFS
uniref:Uncharacterized protein n=1 Tax=Oryza sativa subsp. japonica TaxID=39947 RepID=Q6ZKK6_ORYSJ|nr:hypothetical protein [Oryza sativa Japonica Group]